MAAVRGRWMALAAGALALAAAGAAAQETAYRCESRGHVTYSQVPCPGGRLVGATPRRVTDKWTPPPQVRATLARRARLSDEDRESCQGLDRELRAHEISLKARGEAATLQDEMPLVQAKKRYRELKC